LVFRPQFFKSLSLSKAKTSKKTKTGLTDNITG